MKMFNTIVKLLTALATLAGIVYILATYGEQMVAWAKKTLASLPKCPCCKEDEADESVVEEAVEEEAAEAEAVEEAPAEEAPVAEEEIAAEEPAPEVVVAENEPVAEEQDFAE